MNEYKQFTYELASFAGEVIHVAMPTGHAYDEDTIDKILRATGHVPVWRLPAGDDE